MGNDAYDHITCLEYTQDSSKPTVCEDVGSQFEPYSAFGLYSFKTLIHYPSADDPSIFIFILVMSKSNDLELYIKGYNAFC